MEPSWRAGSLRWKPIGTMIRRLMRTRDEASEMHPCSDRRGTPTSISSTGCMTVSTWSAAHREQRTPYLSVRLNRAMESRSCGEIDLIQTRLIRAAGRPIREARRQPLLQARGNSAGHCGSLGPELTALRWNRVRSRYTHHLPRPRHEGRSSRRPVSVSRRRLRRSGAFWSREIPLYRDVNPRKRRGSQSTDQGRRWSSRQFLSALSDRHRG